MLRLKSLVPMLLLAGLFAAPQLPAQTAQAPMPSQAMIQLGNEATNWLQDLIRINTTNPPGNELAAAKYIGAILDKEGIHYEIFETAPGRGFIVARLSSTPVPDPARALLLMGHLDVVGVDRSKWTVDPFGGVINGGYLYGRGAVDDKAMTIANLATLIELKRTNAHLNRDVIFLAEPDEEDGGTQGMQVIVDKYWDKIAAGFAINESGQVAMKDGKVQYVGVQVSEKVAANVDVVAKGTSGHASIPLKDNPIAHLAAAITKISAYEPPAEFDSVTRAYFETLSNVEDEDTAKWMKVLETPDRGDHAARIISDENPVWAAMIHNTISPTILEAGVRRNVIPAEAKAVLNIRLLPGDSLEVTLAKLTSLVNDPEISFSIEPGTSEPAPSSSVTSDLYQAITHVAATEFPGAPVTPYLSTGATDSSFLRERNVQAYGLLPFPLTEADRLTMHADNERIPLDSFHKGIDFLYTVVSDFAVEK
ncbi:MAG TPA: M20/M25/M40 family metallo-hydrolase [Candidatus Aquilonibacter sp.]|nr:M20/M25/M40 family metallo-hydrolase [Candidatus Aquilonibacter sp.]